MNNINMIKKSVLFRYFVIINQKISHSKERDDVIFSNGLQEARSSGQGLKSCTHCGEE